MASKIDQTNRRLMIRPHGSPRSIGASAAAAGP